MHEASNGSVKHLTLYLDRNDYLAANSMIANSISFVSCQSMCGYGHATLGNDGCRSISTFRTCHLQPVSSKESLAHV
jgi:hypothetical protein